MKIAAMAAATTTLMAASAFAGGLFDVDDCKYTAQRQAAAPAAGVTRVVIHAESGSLKVDGVTGTGQVTATGTACTSDDDFLPRMTLTAARRGSELHITANIPEKNLTWGFFQAQLDFAVTMPPGIPVTIEDDSGWIKVANTGALTIDDDSGAIEVRNIRGSVQINDDSGAISIDTVAGAVTIEDDSGEISIKHVRGNIVIEDDSGAIIVAHVRGDVTIEDDSSGAIQVADIGGNFTVAHKSSGGIEYERVAGRVRIPEKHRD